MTREQQREIKEAKARKKAEDKQLKKAYAIQAKSWKEFERKMKERGAWVEEADPNGDDKQYN